MKKLALPLLALAAPAHAAAFQDIAALETRVVNALGAGVGEAGGPAAPLDRRLKLARCPGSVAIDAPVMGAVALRCAALGWRIRVPIARLGGATPQPGMAVKAEPVVRRGDPVDLVAETQDFSVSLSGVAQEDGAPGSRIRIKAEGAAGILFAEVVDAGRARLPGFK